MAKLNDEQHDDILILNYSLGSMWIIKATANHHQTQQWEDRDADIYAHTFEFRRGSVDTEV